MCQDNFNSYTVDYKFKKFAKWLGGLTHESLTQDWKVLAQAVSRSDGSCMVFLGNQIEFNVSHTHMGHWAQANCYG